MENKLISMVDFVLYQGNPSNTDSQFSDKVMAYANFLKQPLELWMFVPCKLVDGVWLVLEEPYYYKDFKFNLFNKISEFDKIKCLEYQEARERCLFEGFKYNDGYLVNGMNCINLKIHHNVEEIIAYNIVLTPTSLKKIGL